MADISGVVNLVKAQLTSLLAEFAAVKTLWGAMKMVPHVVTAVEQVCQGAGGLNGAEKRAVAVQVLNDLIDLPLVPDALEGFVIGKAVDLVVWAANFFAAKWVQLGLFQNKKK